MFSETLKFYLERGIKVTKVHRAIRFEVKAILADYIKFNTAQRAASGQNECKRTFFKMMNNAPYGKTIENVAKRTNSKVLTDMEKARRMAEKPQCINCRLFNPDLVATKSRKVNQIINKPFQLGFAVLEYSKLHMYRTYATLKDNFGPRMHILYTDTDSLILQFFTHDRYKEQLDVPQLRGLFDFSEIFAKKTPATPVSPTTPTKEKSAYSRTRLRATQSLSLLL